MANFRKVFVNAEIYERSAEVSHFEEGCLSIPGINEDVVRPVSIRMRYLDENFEEHDEEFSGYPARVIQHEYDHLDGTLYIDKATNIREAAQLEEEYEDEEFFEE